MTTDKKQKILFGAMVISLLLLASCFTPKDDLVPTGKEYDHYERFSSHAVTDARAIIEYQQRYR